MQILLSRQSKSFLASPLSPVSLSLSLFLSLLSCLAFVGMTGEGRGKVTGEGRGKVTGGPKASLALPAFASDCTRRTINVFHSFIAEPRQVSEHTGALSLIKSTEGHTEKERENQQQ